MPYLVTIGDSVPWGQGLLPEHKYSHIVGTKLREREPMLVDHLLAHSGAVIGVGNAVSAARVHGEVPIGPPTIMEQLDGFLDDPADVRAVVLNGGINDVDIRNILNPWLNVEVLRLLTMEHCFDSMRVLLERTVAKFPDARTKVLVTGYYPILSADSEPFRIPRLLLLHGLQPEPPSTLTTGSFFRLITERCLLFWRESTVAIRQAVDTLNHQIGTARVAFVDPRFGEENAMFARDPWLWGLNRDLSPQDEVVETRQEACDLAIPPHEVLPREQCYRASAGHPNLKGAHKYADAILQAMS